MRGLIQNCYIVSATKDTREEQEAYEVFLRLLPVLRLLWLKQRASWIDQSATSFLPQKTQEKNKRHIRSSCVFCCLRLLWLKTARKLDRPICYIVFATKDAREEQEAHKVFLRLLLFAPFVAKNSAASWIDQSATSF